MANWGLVIGIDRYTAPMDRLGAAVRDADLFSHWLLDQAGGNVPLQNLTLCLEPDIYQPTVNAPWGPAKHDDIVRAIERMLARSAGKGERFFFYFAGHGLSAPINFAYPSAILTSDFEAILPSNSFALPSLYELFQGTEFKQQFFFVDACRNLAFDTDKRLSDYPNPRKPLAPVSPQYIMYATQPGVKSLEVLVPGNERGVFTTTLLEGLKGKSAAKFWDTQNGDYVVRWRSLFKHVESTIIAMKLAATPGPTPLIQEPRQLGEQGAQDPELGRFAANLFPTELLEVSVTPNRVASQASVIVGEMGPTRSNVPPPLPTKVSLPPRAYWVDAAAPGYRRKGLAPVVELYSHCSVVVELEPFEPPPPSPPVSVRIPIAAAPPAAAPGPGMSVPMGERSVYTVAAPEVALEATPLRQETFQLVVTSVDSLSQIEIANEAGEVLETGRQRVVLHSTKPGLYRGRLVSPEGASVEEVVCVLPHGQDIELRLCLPTKPTPAMQWVMATGSFVPDMNGLLQPSETIGSAENLKLSTMLALAAGAHVDPDKHGYKLRQLPIPGFLDSTHDNSCGIQVVLGDERMMPESWVDARVECWPFNGSQLHAGIPALSSFTGTEVKSTVLSPPPGMYWLRLSLDDRSKIVLPVVVTDQRLTLLVVTRELNESIELHHYQLPLQPDAIKYGRDRDPYFPRSQFAALRRIELMQRSVAHGRISPSLPEIEMLLDDKWLDPLAGCLGGYLLIRLGRWKDLDRATQNLTKYYPELPDAWVLRGEYFLLAGERNAAAGAYREALDKGIPLYRDGVALLQNSIVDLALNHVYAGVVGDILKSIPSGSLWAAGDEALDEVASKVWAHNTAAALITR
jgi:hypothetical protein